MKSSNLVPLMLVVVSCLNVSCKEEETTYSCVDKMGRSYKTVVIGDQVWMAENLTNKKMSDIYFLDNTYDTRFYAERDFAQYSHFNDNASYYNYGYLYNYKAAIDERLIPDGWRLPTKSDWEKLSDYIKAHPSYDSINWVAKALASKENWTFSDVLGSIGNQRTSNDKYGFNVIPTGYRTILGAYKQEGKQTYFWTSTVESASTGFYATVFSYNAQDIQFASLDTLNSGCYIRCVRDIE